MYQATIQKQEWSMVQVYMTMVRLQKYLLLLTKATILLNGAMVILRPPARLYSHKILILLLNLSATHTCLQSDQTAMVASLVVEHIIREKW